MAAKPKTTRKAASAGGADKAAAPVVSLFRVTLEVTNIDRAKAFYEDLLGMKGRAISAPALTACCVVLDIHEKGVSESVNGSRSTLVVAIHAGLSLRRM